MSKNEPSLVIGIGASAGGLDALKQFFRAIPENSQLSFFVVQHLSPDHKSMLAEILDRETNSRVVQAEDRQKIEVNTAYIIPPDAYIQVADHTIVLKKRSEQLGSRLAVDHLFRSMAEAYQSKAVGLIFSGSGNDGTAGARALKAAGGLVIAQSPKSAEYPSMPRSAIDAGITDQVLLVEKIPEVLAEYAKHPYHANTDNIDQDPLESISTLLKTQEGFNLAQYKDATVQRRIFRRMSLTGKKNISEYITLVRENADERQSLMCDLFINVTDFFRDRKAFEFLEENILGELIERTDEGSEIRIWVAGCATGEEAYTLAILLIEMINKSQKDLSIRIFATDIDESAIVKARKGIYTASVLSGLPSYYLDKYFLAKDDKLYTVKNIIRDKISFAIQNVYSDPPFSNMHLVSCRNLLIYLRKNIQDKVLNSFHFSLNKNGYLFLGSSESIGEHKNLFRTLSSKWRIYQRNDTKNLAYQKIDRPSVFNKNTQTKNIKCKNNDKTNININVQTALLSALPPSVLIDEKNQVVYFHGNVNKFIQLPEGRAGLNFINMLNTDLRARARSGIYKARKTQATVTVQPPASFLEEGTAIPAFQIIFSPCTGLDSEAGSLVVTFEDLSSSYQGTYSNKESLDQCDQEKMIDAMERELAQTKEELQTTNEELETNTEELKAAHEEALSTNEELQSSNEELEASTEELRSINEELTTVNAQLKDKIDELSNTHNDLNNFFASTHLATVVLSDDLKVRRYTPAAERLLKLSVQDIDRPISEIHRTLVDDETLADAKQVLDTLEGSEKELETEDGRWFVRKILPYQTDDHYIGGVVLTFSDISKLKLAVNGLEASGRQQAAIAKLGMDALRGHDITNLFEQTVREIAFTLNADYCKVLEYYPEQGNLLLKAGIGWDHGLVGNATVSDHLDSQAGYTLKASSPIKVDDLSEETRFSSSSLLLDHKVKSGMSCIIENGQHPYGTLSVHTRSIRKFTQDDVNFLVAAANILSVALHRKKTEYQLKENEKRLRIAKDSSRMGAFEYFIESGKVLWEDMLNDIWGVDKEAPVTIDDFYTGLHPSDVDNVIEAMNTSKDPSSNGRYNATYRVINNKNGQQSWVDATGQIIFEDDKPTKMIGMILDVTKQKQLESSLQSAVKELKKVDERKNEFLAMLGHELRNPLAAISSGVHVMENDNSKTKWALNMINNNIRLISSLLDGLLDLTRISKGQIKLNKETLDLNDLLVDIKQNFSQKIYEKDQKLHLQLTQDPIEIWGDRLRLEQAISNILSNSHKFTPRKGIITIELTRSEDQLTLSIRDTGIGIDMKHKITIFEPFQQVEGANTPTSSGMGIGLSIVKKFIELHKGSVNVNSEGIGKGTVFTIHLPITRKGKAVEEIPPTLIDASINAPSLKILLVDDNVDAAKGLATILEIKGHTVNVAFDGKSSLELLHELEPDVIILDIGLPDISGWDLLKTICNTYSKPFYSIALTGYGHGEAHKKSKEAGFNCHLNKPANIAVLLKMLEQAI